MLEASHAGARVVVVLIDIGNLFSERLAGVEIVDLCLDFVVIDHQTVNVGHEHPLVEMIHQGDEIDLSKVEFSLKSVFGGTIHSG